MHLVLDVPRVEGLSRLFFFDDGEARGDLKVDLRVEDLPYPVTKLPVMQGHLTFRGDILHPPALAKPLTGIDLACAFEGERFTIDLSGLRVGKACSRRRVSLSRASMRPDSPLGSTWTLLTPPILRGIYGKRFRVPVIAAGSLAARTTGEFLLKSKTLRSRGVGLRDLVIEGTFGDRTLAVTQGRIEAGKGELAFQGDAYLGPFPGLTRRGVCRT